MAAYPASTPNLLLLHLLSYLPIPNQINRIQLIFRHRTKKSPEICPESLNMLGISPFRGPDVEYPWLHNYSGVLLTALILIFSTYVFTKLRYLTSTLPGRSQGKQPLTLPYWIPFIGSSILMTKNAHAFYESTLYVDVLLISQDISLISDSVQHLLGELSEHELDPCTPISFLV